MKAGDRGERFKKNHARYNYRGESVDTVIILIAWCTHTGSMIVRGETQLLVARHKMARVRHSML